MKALYNAGVLITINSDDPTFFDTTLADEYMTLQQGVPISGIYEMLRNGYKYAFLPQEELHPT